MSAVLAGLAAGAVHVVSGPDHLAALGPDVSRAPSGALALGALWGLGHGAGVLLAAGFGRWLGAVIALERASAWAELSVGFVLVALGVRALTRRPASTPPRGHGAFGVGLLHGAAGAHHLVMALPALLLDETGAALYLAAYLVAAVLAMTGLGGAVAWGLRERGERARRLTHSVAGFAAVGVGLFWVAASL